MATPAFQFGAFQASAFQMDTAPGPGPTLLLAIKQVRELVGDYHAQTFKDEKIIEAIWMAQDLILRMKGYNVRSALYTGGSYPVGTLPSDFLAVKRVEVVIPGADAYGNDDTVLAILRESRMSLEDAASETWRMPSTKPPKRWLLTGNLGFTVVPRLQAGVHVRVYYTRKSVASLNYLDPLLPEYYYGVIRYGAAAYLLENDTDLQSTGLAKQYRATFAEHLAPDSALQISR